MLRDLYLSGVETLVASFEAYARGARDATVLRLPGVTAAVFPHPPERAVYNNALLAPDADLDVMEAAYASASVDRFAAWVHESDEAMRAELAARGYTLDTTTRAMGMDLDDLRVPRPELALDPPEWPAYVTWLESVGVPPGLLARADPNEFHLLIARLLHDARDRGRTTAILQSTEMAEDVYRAVGFRDLGRILEFVPS
jgi:hypothetical protein